MGVEPTSKAWEAFILPMNYTCILSCVAFGKVVRRTADYEKYYSTAAAKSQSFWVARAWFLSGNAQI